MTTDNRPSVVVLGYNRFGETTGPCLSRLAQDPDFSSWDVVLVDNGSDPDDHAKFLAARAQYPSIRFVRLDRNAGYPGGMNVGLAATVGDPLILVSSDILVPVGAVRRIGEAFLRNPKAGMIAPVTNAAGNEQQIFIEPGSDLMEQGRRFAASSADGVVTAYRLDFCCVGLSRAAYRAVGGFDERFAPGYYEDFDYSLRVKAAGFDLLVAENVFIQHGGGGTFGAASSRQRALIARNKQLFLDKHGQSTPMPHVRDGNLDVLAQYLAQAKSGSPPPLYRVANRLRSAAANVPRGILKKWKYRRRLAEIERDLARAFPDVVSPRD